MSTQGTYPSFAEILEIGIGIRLLKGDVEHSSLRNEKEGRRNMCEVTDSSGRHRDRYGKDSLLREYHPVINQNLVTLTWTAY